MFCICVGWPSRDLPWSRTSINILFLNLLKPVVYYPSFSPSCITPAPAICIISSLLLSVFFRAVCECGVSLSRRPTSEESIKRLCFFLLPTRYVNKVYFPFPQIVCVYVFYFGPCEDFHIYQMSTANMPPLPRGCFFVFAVSRWFHIFWTPKETCFKNNYLVCTGTQEPSNVTSHGSAPAHFMVSLMRFFLWSYISQASSHACLFRTIFSGFIARNENFPSLSWTFSRLIWCNLSPFSAFYKYSGNLLLPVLLPFPFTCSYMSWNNL